MLLISYNHEISAVAHLDFSIQRTNQCQTDLLQITRRLESSATCSYKQLDSSWVEHASWLLLIPLWLEDNYIFLRTIHIVSLSSPSPFPLHQIMAPRTPHPGVSRSQSSWLTDALSNIPPSKTQQQTRLLFVHYDAANAATQNLTEDTRSSVDHTAESRMNKKCHVTGLE